MKARGARPPDADGRVLKRNDGYLPRSGPLGPDADIILSLPREAA